MFTFDTPPRHDRDELRIIIGDIQLNDGPAPNRDNLDDAILDYFLEAAGDVPGAAVLAFEHLAALWISRPIFGPGELSTIHTNLYEKYMKLAEEWRGRSSAADADIPSGPVVVVSGFTREDGYTDDASEFA